MSRSLNSNIVLDDVPRQSSTSADTTQNKSELKAMMCFVVHTPERRYDYGTIYAHDPGNTDYGLMHYVIMVLMGCMKNSGENMMTCFVIRCDL